MSFCAQRAYHAFGLAEQDARDLEDHHFLEKWGYPMRSENLVRQRQPPLAYSKRSQLIAQLRKSVESLPAERSELLAPPSVASQALAEAFINELPHDAVMSARMAISDAGEINFFFGSSNGSFRAIFCGEGEFSYYGKVGANEFFGDDLPLREFPFLKLVHIV